MSVLSSPNAPVALWVTGAVPFRVIVMLMTISAIIIIAQIYAAIPPVLYTEDHRCDRF